MSERRKDAGEPEAPEALVEAGKLIEAAHAYRRLGDLARAERLYADLWDFHAAAEVARERGDLPAELGHLLSANDAAAAAIVGRALERGAEPELRRAAEMYERHRRWIESATLRERLGELGPARELYRRGHALLEVARIERGLGRLREAGLAYEQLLAAESEGDEAARAHLELGQLLLGLDRPDEAARHLQTSAKQGDGKLRFAALGDLVIALARLGYDAAADAVLDELRVIAPTTPARAEFIARHRAMPLSGPTRLGGRYEIERLLGASASGRVFLARDAISGRRVAVKSSMTPGAGRAQRSWQRFFAEARLTSTLRHPNIVEVLEVDESQGLLVMEYLPGGTLRDRLSATSALSPAMVRRMLLDVVDGLGAVHARGIVHRDLKPASLFFTATGQARIGDFGTAHLFAEEATQTAGFVGTLAYMAPEQMSGGAIGAAADLYSLGAIAFHALTGQLPFTGPDFIAQHLTDPPPTPSARIQGLDPAWDPIIVSLLQKSPTARPSSLDALRRELAAVRVTDDVVAPEPDSPESAPPSEQPRFLRLSALPDGAGGPISVGRDTRLGRPVTIETLSAEWLATIEGQRHLTWLRDLARAGGPRLQHVYAFIRRDDGGLDAIFEATPIIAARAANRDSVRHKLAVTFATLHAAGIAHGSILSAVVETSHGPMVRIAGLTPRLGATPDDDRRAIAEL